MSEIETRTPKTIDEKIKAWREINRPALDFIVGSPVDGEPVFVPFPDIEGNAAAAGISVEELYERASRAVGDLGNAALKPVPSRRGNGFIDLDIGFLY